MSACRNAYGCLLGNNLSSKVSCRAYVVRGGGGGLFGIYEFGKLEIFVKILAI